MKPAQLAGAALAGVATQHATKRALAFVARRSLRQISHGRASMAYHLLQPETLHGLLQSFDLRLSSLLTGSDERRLVEQARIASEEARLGALGTDTEVAAVSFVLAHGGASLFRASSLLGPALAEQLLTEVREVSPNRMLCCDAAVPASYFPFTPPNATGVFPTFRPFESMFVIFPSHYPSRWVGHIELIRALTYGVRVTVAVRNETWERLAAVMFQHANVNLDRVEFVRLPYDDMWARDAGPEFCNTPSGPVLLSHPYLPSGLGFHPRDSEYSSELGRLLGLPVHRIPLVIDGAHIKVANSRSMFVSAGLASHNPDRTQSGVNEILREWFGVDSLIPIPTLPNETTGHVDLSLLPVDEEHVIVGKVSSRHPWHHSLEALASQLQQTATQDGGRYRVTRLEGPRNVPRFHEWSYVNSVIANDVVVMPSYGKDDDQARKTLEKAFPNREVITAHCADLAVGAVHCLTKELPVRKERPTR